MKLVSSLGILVALSLASCSRGSDSPTSASPSAGSPPAAPTSNGSRRNTARDAIPAPLLPLLPVHGIYASGGGRTSTPWRVVVDLVAKNITSAVGNTPGIPPTNALDHQSTRPLTEAERLELTGLSERAWREPMPVLGTPNGDYDEILLSVDGEDIFFLEGFGPIRPPEASVLVGKLKKIAVGGP